MRIELAADADATAIGVVHVETWAVTYRDLLPPRFYEERLDAHRHRDWHELIAAQQAAGDGVLVARGGDGLGVLEADPRAVSFYEYIGWVADGARRVDGAVDLRYRCPLRLPAGRTTQGSS